MYILWECPICKQHFGQGTSHQHKDGTWINELQAEKIKLATFRVTVVKKLDEILQLLQAHKETQ